MSDELKDIPISAAKEIANKYGYDQIVIIGRRVGEPPQPCGEHVTTYGRNKIHCTIAARIGDFFKYKLMGWPNSPIDALVEKIAVEIIEAKKEIYAESGVVSSRLNWALDALSKLKSNPTPDAVGKRAVEK